MGMLSLLFLIIIGVAAYYYIRSNGTMTIDNLHDTYRWGALHKEVICPHCQSKGNVYYQHLDRKKGVSGGKAVGALLTGGVSMLATGLSRKEKHIQAHCVNCNTTWDI
jgi:hypothetical protein